MGREREREENRERKGTKITKYHKLRGKEKIKKTSFYTHRETIHIYYIYTRKPGKEATSFSVLANLNKFTKWCIMCLTEELLCVEPSCRTIMVIR